jgi:hypothetical protein
MKVARTVLRGEGHGNVALLPDARAVPLGLDLRWPMHATH